MQLIIFHILQHNVDLNTEEGLSCIENVLLIVSWLINYEMIAMKE